MYLRIDRIYFIQYKLLIFPLFGEAALHYLRIMLHRFICQQVTKKLRLAKLRLQATSFVCINAHMGMDCIVDARNETFSILTVPIDIGCSKLLNVSF
jgi:hypothetical protein